MTNRYRLKTSKQFYKQLLTSDVAIVRPDHDDVDSILVMHPALLYRHYVIKNIDAIGYVAYQGWQNEGRGFVALTPLWEKEEPEFAVMYVSEANILKLPLLEPLIANRNRFPHWYIKLAELVRSQIYRRLNNYNPEAESIILGQVEDTSQIFPDDQLYQQIDRVEIFNFCDFETSLQTCYERFKNRACEFIL
ncbi:hypothetical protein [Aliterella atlantica]|uniref:Uncharacterized protein n=1 Tax=Aliterella atlantica CENA595 TaxID=1618023 RepID=A0A0D8ZTZ7_9CYAN|nr:hypothetical protein [Aliterella atlantica]KJH71944.1 hypothetical protein UH38_09485 [Aliterella atlantica CENA595]